MEQNIKNHRRFYPPFHFLLIPLTLICCLVSIIMLFREAGYTNAMIAALSCLLLLTALLSRIFALKAQDRAIRAEENLRYFSLTGKLFPAALKRGQIIALRFANDEELIALTDRAVTENLSSNDIKMTISAWRGDHHRV